ncbi:MAG TPA: discoidin domain-containing protein [Steroidobacteraceae bacterium]|nr:discoidin domain-containing protein [Steroidobacteraceae bacterium]
MTGKNPEAAAFLSEWQPTASGNAVLALSMRWTGHVPALRMDFDFKGGGGFVVARRILRRTMPNEYAVQFQLRGSGAVNDLELKLVDDSGLNVWRHKKEGLRLPRRWTRMRVESRDIDFAWGPASGSGISTLGALEFAIVAREGGKGTLWIAGVEIEDCDPREVPQVSASSAQPDFEAARALGSGWKPQPDDPRPWLVIDSLQPRLIGGLTVDWLDAAPAGGFRVRASNGGRRWTTVHTAARAGGRRTNVYLPGLKTRFLRLELEGPSGAALQLRSFEFSRSIHAFWHHIAGAEARGWHPRWLHREQTLWTPIGTSHGTHCALMNGDGMVEVGLGSFSIEPMLFIEGRLFTWSDVDFRQELLDDWMPVPATIWEAEDWRLRIQAEATSSGAVRLRYRFENLADRPSTARLFVLLRPFQVTPPWQNFRKLGGVSEIHDIVWHEGAVCVNDTMLVVPVTRPAGFGSLCFDDGFIASHLGAGTLPRDTEVHDPFGFASGALDFELPGKACDVVLECMPVGARTLTGEPAFDWSTKLPVNQWSGGGWLTEVIRAALTATAHILVTRSGAALQPGPRRYTRSWIRDGAMMSAALLRMGRTVEVREFIRWYAPHQRADGFVPCCIDNEGVDWLVEHDSHGQLLALIADYHRFAPDDRFLADLWPFVVKAAGCIERLQEENGLLPISVSHEGYLAQPVHSFWDDFWALRGLRDAVHLAQAMGREDCAAQWETVSKRLDCGLFASIQTTRSQRKLDFIPGSIEWADFDPTATANALYLLDIPDGIDREALERTFDMYLADWRRKRSDESSMEGAPQGAPPSSPPSANYTPYEIRIIGALVRLGRRDAALELLRFFMSDRRPRPWNQWPEIAWRDRKAPAHLGDLPHTWIAGEYVLAVRSLFAYERESDQSLIVAAGLAPEWLEGAGVTVNKMPTLYGTLSYSLRRLDSATVRFEITTAMSAKVILRPPLAGPLRSATINGTACPEAAGDSVILLGTPAEVVCVTS